MVLCAEVGTNHPSAGLVGKREQLAGQVRPVKDKANTFTLPPEILRQTAGAATELTLEPFYKMHGPRHYAVYWDVTNPPNPRMQK